MPVAEIALPRAATRCFPDPVSRDSNGLVLISFRLARTRACATPRTRSASTPISTTYGHRQHAVAIFRSVISRASAPVGGCVFAIEELLSPDLDQIKQGNRRRETGSGSSPSAARVILPAARPPGPRQLRCPACAFRRGLTPPLLILAFAGMTITAAIGP